jgi:hypothetical protein
MRHCVTASRACLVRVPAVSHSMSSSYQRQSASREFFCDLLDVHPTAFLIVTASRAGPSVWLWRSPQRECATSSRAGALLGDRGFVWVCSATSPRAGPRSSPGTRGIDRGPRRGKIRETVATDTIGITVGSFCEFSSRRSGAQSRGAGYRPVRCRGKTRETIATDTIGIAVGSFCECSSRRSAAQSGRAEYRPLPRRCRIRETVTTDTIAINVASFGFVLRVLVGASEDFGLRRARSKSPCRIPGG